VLSIHFNIRNPWSRRQETIKEFHGKTWLDDKFWELEFSKTAELISLSVSITHRQSHAGLDFDLGLLGYSISFNFYDRRHWDYRTDKWGTYHER
jgi:hypothetical protein